MARMGIPAGGAREETPEEKAKWSAFKKYLAKEVQPRDGGTFEVRGYIKSITGDPENPNQWLTKLNPRSGKMEAKGNVVATVSDPRFPGLEWKKEAKVSFFDGAMRDGSTSPYRGFFFWIHRAVTGENPSPALVSGKGDFDPDDYVGPDKPVMLKLKYEGRVEEGSQYYGRRGNMTIWLDGFEPIPEKVAAAWGDDDDEDDGLTTDDLGGDHTKPDDGPEPWDDADDVPF